MNRKGELAIYEVHDDDDGRVQGYSAEPSFPAAPDLDALQLNCELYLAALREPVLTYE
ncbi:hypothetical protein [Roseateles flavus]|uniref:Uncharacterized protein n=1 Tax=Roseateles flavus TaxID=3149041 RepID=A0ABV0GDZ9_9BURK